MNAHLFLTIFCLFVSASAWTKSFVIDGSKFSLDVPKEWKESKDLFGMPLTLSGPMKEESRPVITVTPTEIKKVSFDLKNVDVVNADYKSQRLKWLQKHKGEFLTLTPYKKQVQKKIESHSVGYSYRINETTFIEKSYYVVCNEQLFHLKYLMRETQKELLNETEKIVESFRCTR